MIDSREFGKVVESLVLAPRLLGPALCCSAGVLKDLILLPAPFLSVGSFLPRGCCEIKGMNIHTELRVVLGLQVLARYLYCWQ